MYTYFTHALLHTITQPYQVIRTHVHAPHIYLAKYTQTIHDYAYLHVHSYIYIYTHTNVNNILQIHTLHTKCTHSSTPITMQIEKRKSSGAKLHACLYVNFYKQHHRIHLSWGRTPIVPKAHFTTSLWILDNAKFGGFLISLLFICLIGAMILMPLLEPMIKNTHECPYWRGRANR